MLLELYLGQIDDKGRWLYYNPALLAQMNSEVFESPIAREAFSFDQLLEIVSIENAENVLNSILLNPNSKKLLISIGKDSQSWQAKFQYLMDLEENKRVDIINNFGDNGESLIQKELARRKEWFDSMERGYFEDEEYEDLCKKTSLTDYEIKQVVKYANKHYLVLSLA